MLWIPLTATALGIAAIVLALSILTYRMTFYNKHKEDFDPYHSVSKDPPPPFADVSRGLIDRLIAEPCEEVSITAHDGAVLSGRYYHTRDGAPIDLMLHGYKSGALHDFPGGALAALALGHNVLLVDQRGHGGSGGRSIAFGIRERFDCVDWVKYAIERFGEDVAITLVGISMGAATVILASELELPSAVRGIIADCPYSSAELMIRKTAAELGFPEKLVFPFIRLGGRLFGGFDICERTPLEAARCARLPLLLIHGTDDDFVPCDMSREIAAAYGGECRLELFEGARHGTSYLVDTPRYLALLSDFYEKIIDKEEINNDE